MCNLLFKMLILFTVLKSICAFSFYREATLFKKFISVLIRAFSNVCHFEQMVIVKIPDESIVLLCLLTITIVLYKWFTRGRHSTPQSSSTTISRPTNLNVYNTMQLDMERRRGTIEVQL